ncbi:MAG: DUF5316 family protein [Bacillota bacterium]|nr:DUF5316 family protein [Bacillota bacterium]MDW7682856.1 DUF5316 family protein [Bacillota bacterium]
MIISLVAGICMVLLLAAAAALRQDMSSFQNAALAISLLSFAGAGVLTNAFNSGDKARANFATEDKADRQARTTWAGRLFFFGLPLFVALILSYKFF